MQRPKYSSLSEYISSVKSVSELLDLKEQFDEELWRQHFNKLYKGEESSRRRDKSFYKSVLDDMKSIVNNGSALTNFLAYKGLPALCGFDCDGTISHDHNKQGYYSWFMREIYRTLWNWQDLYETDEKEFKNMMVKRFAKSCFEDMEMGPDTMNSFWITFCAYLISFYDDTYKWNGNFKNTFLFKTGENGEQRKRAIRLKSDIKNRVETRINNKNIDRFAQLTHTIGNMVLVPAGYNGYRGTKYYLKDYFDLSLCNLLHNSWDSNNYLVKKDEERQWKFRKYINTFFLWDYVDETYDVKPLCESHKEKMLEKTLNGTNVLPAENEIDDLCIEINRRIERRSCFMLAMLKIALGMNYDRKSKYEYHEEQHKEWNTSGIYKLFMDEVFLNDNVYNGYGDIIEKMADVATDKVKGRTSEAEWKWLYCVLKEMYCEIDKVRYIMWNNRGTL